MNKNEKDFALISARIEVHIEGLMECQKLLIKLMCETNGHPKESITYLQYQINKKFIERLQND